MSYHVQTAIAKRCEANPDYPALIEAYYIIKGTGDHTHAMRFRCEREREAFETKHRDDLELWEIFYGKAIYIAPLCWEKDPWWVKERELRKAWIDAPRGTAQEWTAKVAYYDYFNARYGRHNREN